MFDLIEAKMVTVSEWDQYRSHPLKPLRVHTHGVLEGVRRRTSLRLPQIVALFHDLGKLNRNFQAKLDDDKVTAYSNHSYLSAWAFLQFIYANSQAGRELGLNGPGDVFTAATLIAHHHGDLPDLREILKVSERERLARFLASNPNPPISNYLNAWLEHESFNLWDAESPKRLEKCSVFKDNWLEAFPSKLDYFLETQFGFAALLESDKRDAGDNKWFRREDQLAWASDNFSPCLLTKLAGLDGKSDLNRARTAIRINAVESLGAAIKRNERVFSLTAPTGAGKTLVLLSLAETIRRHYPEHSVCYTLPFLTITEQVEGICRGIFGPDFVTRIDSRSCNPELERLLIESEIDPSKAADILKLGFSNETFDAAYIITTFVQVFETLMTNRGASLLRLPNFSKTIFLIDEIQSLPPRLYVFFSAFLDAFCRKFDSYAILSTATMPALDLAEENKEARTFFPGYQTPTELLDFHTHYRNPVFDRYRIQRIDEEHGLTLDNLAEKLKQETESCLVIVNTIDDSRRLYKILCPGEPQLNIALLNTRFTLEDRQATIAKAQQRLCRKERIFLISTQLIEAGVDIDFPVVYRDLCPLPSVIQSAGRCNRNGNRRNDEGELIQGDVKFFELLDSDTNKARAAVVYRDPADKWSLDFSRQYIQSALTERELLEVQMKYFRAVNQNLKIGDHRLRSEGVWKRDNLIHRINEMSFEVVGSFRLIDEDEFGQERRYYVPRDNSDNMWETLGEYARAVAEASNNRADYTEMKLLQTKMLNHASKMSGRVVQFRFRATADAPQVVMRKNEVIEYCGLCKLLNPENDYNKETGLQTHGQGIAIF